MRSKLFTLLLILIASSTVWLTVVRLREGNLSRIFGAPQTKIGAPLYSFPSNQVRKIAITTGSGTSAECYYDHGIWYMSSPWKDRMNPQAAATIIGFTLGTRVVDAFSVEKLTTNQKAFRDGITKVRLDDVNGTSLARYHLGRRTSFISYDEEKKQEYPTIFVQPRDRSRKNFTYACTDYGLQILFKDNFRFLRDHHPFLMDPLLVSSVRMRSAEGEMQLTRGTDKSPWHISKPLELGTNPKKVKQLLENLFEFQAIRILNRSEVTLPTSPPKGNDLIAIRHFGIEKEVVMEIYPPADEKSETVYATVSDRPDAVLELLRKPLPGSENDANKILSLEDLPNTVNELRNRTLTNLNPASLQSIQISSSTSAPVLLTRDQASQSGKWMLDLGATKETANELTLFEFLKTLSEAEVTSFASDAATDLAAYGLDRPILSVRFLSFNNEGFSLNFGLSKDGMIYANRMGTTTVACVSEKYLKSIAPNAWRWKNPHVWSISPADFTQCVRQVTGKPALTLDYNFASEQWRATENGKDRTSDLSTEYANHILNALLNLDARTWLPPDEPEAVEALSKPIAAIMVTSRKVNEEGDDDGVQKRILYLAPKQVMGGAPEFYARVDGIQGLFLLDAEQVIKMMIDPLARD
jgi:Domain of unknown function (DUF4340)